MTTNPTPKNTIIINLGWVVAGAIIGIIMWMFLENLEWVHRMPKMVRSGIAYTPLLVVNIVAHIATILRGSKSVPMTYHSIYISSLLGSMFGAFIFNFVIQ